MYVPILTPSANSFPILPQLAENPTVLDSSDALQAIAKGGHVVYMLCKDVGKPLEYCLCKMVLGDTSNGNKHLKRKCIDSRSRHSREKLDQRKRSVAQCIMLMLLSSTHLNSNIHTIIVSPQKRSISFFCGAGFDQKQSKRTKVLSPAP